MPLIRRVRETDLAALLELYRHLHPNDQVIEMNESITGLWKDILSNSLLFYFVTELDGRLVSTCVLSITLNLTRGARPYGLIENVVTHADYRKRGLATALLKHALETAWDLSCYKVMLLTGSKKRETLRFYQNAGFKIDLKTGFIATPA